MNILQYIDHEYSSAENSSGGPQSRHTLRPSRSRIVFEDMEDPTAVQSVHEYSASCYFGNLAAHIAGTVFALGDVFHPSPKWIYAYASNGFYEFRAAPSARGTAREGTQGGRSVLK
jgi:hypothetical protein